MPTIGDFTTWPVSAAGFQLESALNSSGAFAWLPVQGATVVGANNTITHPTSNSFRLYRLKKSVSVDEANLLKH